MRTLPGRDWLIAGALICLAGCASLESRKVPLRARLEQRDDHIDGFRYYTSRPYVAVSRRIDLGYEMEVGVLGYAGEDQSSVILAVPQEGGAVTYYNGEGNIVRLGNMKFSPILRPEDSEKPAAKKPAAKKPAAKAPMKKEPMKKVPELPGGIEVGNQSNRDGGFGAPPHTQRSLLAGMANAADSHDANPSESAMKVIMLPDFTEQIAVSDRNIAAYSNYSLTFRDGWQLTTAEGSWDSTAVPVKVLQVLQNAIRAGTNVKLERLKKEAADKKDEGGPSTKEVVVSSRGRLVRGVLIRHEYIRPGVYKLLKRCECGEAMGQGLLSEIGMPSEYATTLRVLSD